MIPACYQNYKFNSIGVVDKNKVIEGRKIKYSVLPSFMQFDQRNGILLAQPKSYDAEGDYLVYGRVAYLLPETVFEKFAELNTSLYSSLVRLNYIDKDGFVTEEFKGDLKWLDDKF